MPISAFLTDGSLCIGCKACEVSCKAWNELPDDGFSWSGNSYDNTRALGASTWRHVLFLEQKQPMGPQLANIGDPFSLAVSVRCLQALRQRGMPRSLKVKVPQGEAGSDRQTLPIEVVLQDGVYLAKFGPTFCPSFIYLCAARAHGFLLSKVCVLCGSNDYIQACSTENASFFGAAEVLARQQPYFGAKHPCSAVIVQLLCNQKSTQNTTVYATVDIPNRQPHNQNLTTTLAHPTPLGRNKFVDQTSNNR